MTVTVRVSVTISGTRTVFSTVSHVPHAGAGLHAVPQELAPQGLQSEAQGAEQHELDLLPKQPACADAVIATAAASDRTKRMSPNSSSNPLILESTDSDTCDPSKNTLE